MYKHIDAAINIAIVIIMSIALTKTFLSDSEYFALINVMIWVIAADVMLLICIVYEKKS